MNPTAAEFLHGVRCPSFLLPEAGSLQLVRFPLIQKMRLAGAWMTEKYFAATPYKCHKQSLDKHNNMQHTLVDCIMAYGNILLKLKDFEGIYATAYQ